MNNNFDFDINKYNISDLIQLFNISENLDEEDLIKCKTVINQLKENNIDQQIIKFYSTSYFLLVCIKKYREFLIINNFNYRITNIDDQFIYKKIIEYSNFDNFNEPLILINTILSNNNNSNSNNNNSNNNNNNNSNNENSTNKLLIQLIDEIKSNNRMINVHNNTLNKGEINPLRRITQLVNVHFNSCFRENYYNSNPSNYKYTIPTGGINNTVSMKLSSIEIPNSWYLFSHLIGNNKFIIEITHCDECSIHNIIIPDGNYDRESIINFLNEKYFMNSTNKLLKHIEIAIDNYTNKTYFKLLNTVPDDFIFSLHFVEKEQENILETFGWILGFRLSKYLKIDDIIQAEGLFDGGGDRYVYLCINDYQYNYNENNIVCFDGMSINENILAKIPLLNGKFSLIINENDSNPLIKIRRYNAPVNINKLEIKLLDKFGNIINLNNMDWSFSLEFEVLYENLV